MTSRAAAEVAPGVFVTTSSKYDTSSIIVRSGSHVLLVDPAWTTDELDGLERWLHAHECTVTTGFVTHAHHDHMLWHPGFGTAPRWASPTTTHKAAEWRAELEAALDAYPPEWPHPFDGIRALDSATIPLPFGDGGGQESIELVVHDGHAPGHTALLLADRGVLLAGDMLSDIELPLPFNPDDLPVYLDALDRLAPVVRRAGVLVPGHGHATNRPLARLDADRRYLDDVLAGRDPDDPRRALKGMDEAHAKIVQMAAALPK
ncbi:MAG: MBL fold metallo-hydrolase [Actinomycetota bacterium]|nr:MBL fold metallo-hydrolase [Actinomycetota bacterium]